MSDICCHVDAKYMINRESISRSSKVGPVEGVHPAQYSAYDAPPLQLQADYQLPAPDMVHVRGWQRTVGGNGMKVSVEAFFCAKLCDSCP